MARILVFQHVAAEPLGTLDALIRARGHRIRFVNFGRDPDAQPDISRYQALIVLGGPMNVVDRKPLDHLHTELKVIEQALARSIPVLGICLGSQLLAHCLGAPVGPADHWEIGWYKLFPSKTGATDPIFGHIQPGSPVFQWHEHAFEVPESAVNLGQGCHLPHQAFRYGPNAYGFQFHLEMEEKLIHRWLTNPAYREALQNSGLAHGPEEIIQEIPTHLPPMQGLAEEVFGSFLDLLEPPRKRIALPSR